MELFREDLIEERVHEIVTAADQGTHEEEDNVAVHVFSIECKDQAELDEDHA